MLYRANAAKAPVVLESNLSPNDCVGSFSAARWPTCPNGFRNVVKDTAPNSAADLSFSNDLSFVELLMLESAWLHLRRRGRFGGSSSFFEGGQEERQRYKEFAWGADVKLKATEMEKPDVFCRLMQIKPTPEKPFRVKRYALKNKAFSVCFCPITSNRGESLLSFSSEFSKCTTADARLTISQLWNLKIHRSKCTYPTEYFPILEPQNPSIYPSQLNLVDSQSMDLEAPKIANCSVKDFGC